MPIIGATDTASQRRAGNYVDRLVAEAWCIITAPKPPPGFERVEPCMTKRS
jgi:hypothetical protein